MNRRREADEKMMAETMHSHFTVQKNLKQIDFGIYRLFRLILKLIRTGCNCENVINSRGKYGSANSWSRVKNTILFENSTFWIIEGFCFAMRQMKLESKLQERASI
jgi:hypothetical protein